MQNALFNIKSQTICLVIGSGDITEVIILLERSVPGIVPKD